MPIIPAVNAVNEAVKEILEYQHGNRIPVKTRYSHFNYNLLGGIYPGNIIVIAGLSSSGKSFTSQTMEEDLFNPVLNPHCEKIRLVRCNFEMRVFNLVLRRLSRETGLDIDEILENRVMSENECKSFKRVVDKERSNHIFYYPEPVTSEQFMADITQFLETMKSEDPNIHTIITVDHVGYINGGDSAITNFMSGLNALKMKGYRFSAIILSQLNREIVKRSDNKLRHAPESADVFNSSQMYFVSDLMLAIHQPAKLGITEYMEVKNKFPELGAYKTSSGNSFKTEGLVFFHYIKIREERKKKKNIYMAIEVKSGYERLYQVGSDVSYVNLPPAYPIPEAPVDYEEEDDDPYNDVF